jgi:hypothetical protein
VALDVACGRAHEFFFLKLSIKFSFLAINCLRRGGTSHLDPFKGWIPGLGGQGTQGDTE